MPTDIVARPSPPAQHFRLCRVVVALALYGLARVAIRSGSTLAELAERIIRK